MPPRVLTCADSKEILAVHKKLNKHLKELHKY